MSHSTASPVGLLTGQRTSADVPTLGTSAYRPEIDEAAFKLLCVLPEGFEEEHASALAAAVAEVGWSVEDARRLHYELRALLPEEVPSVSPERPWRALEDALRRAGEREAVDRLRALRAALRSAREEDSWTFADLDALDDPRTVEYAPGPLAERIVYREGLTTLAGHGGSGKSTVAQAVALDAMRAGTFVVHLDWEQGPDATMRKYRQLGARSEEMRGSLGYLWEPGVITRERLRQVVDGRDAFVLVDSFSKAAAAAGLTGTDWAGHGALANDLNAFGVESGCPVLLIDHRAKRDGKSTRWADGAHGKYDAASAQWNVDVGRKFSDTAAGEIVLTNVKARHAGLDGHARIVLGGDGMDVICVRRAEQGDVPALKIERDIVRFLRGCAVPASKADIEREISGKTDAKRAALERLASDPESPVREVQDGRWIKYAAMPDRLAPERGESGRVDA